MNIADAWYSVAYLVKNAAGYIASAIAKTKLPPLSIVGVDHHVHAADRCQGPGPVEALVGPGPVESWICNATLGPRLPGCVRLAESAKLTG